MNTNLLFENLNTFKKKIQSEHPELTMNQIEYYIFRFNEIRSSSRFKAEVKRNYPEIKNPNDVTKYTFEQLEHLVDLFADKKEKYAIEVEVDNSKSIYDEDGIEIFLADSKNKCIKYRQEFENHTKQQYSFCISRTGENNLYYSYRFKKEEPTFYFIINKQLPITDTFHVIVVHVNNTPDSYNLTNSTNSNELHNLTWNDLVKNVPYLKNLKHLFKPMGLNPDEQKLKDVSQHLGEEVTDLMAYFKSYEKVEAYIEYGHELSFSQFKSIPEDLQMKYINKGHNMPANMLKILNPKLLKNYQRILLIKFKESKYNLENLPSIREAFFMTGIPDSVFLDMYNTNKSLIPKMIGARLLKKSKASQLFKHTFQTAYEISFTGERLWDTASEYMQNQYENPLDSFLNSTIWDFIDNWEPSVDDSLVDDCRENIDSINLSKIKNKIIEYINSSDYDADDFEYTEDEIRIMTVSEIAEVLENYDSIDPIESINSTITSVVLSAARTSMEDLVYNIIEASIVEVPGFEYIKWNTKEVVCYLTFKEIGFNPKDYSNEYKAGDYINAMIYEHLQYSKFYKYPDYKLSNASWNYDMDYGTFNEYLKDELS